MSAFDSVMKGLNEAVAYEQGKLEKIKVDCIGVSELPRFQGAEIRKIRMKQHMTQKTMAAVLGVSNKTVEAWESGKNVPAGPAQRLLELMNKDEVLFERYAVLSKK